MEQLIYTIIVLLSGSAGYFFISKVSHRITPGWMRGEARHKTRTLAAMSAGLVVLALAWPLAGTVLYKFCIVPFLVGGGAAFMIRGDKLPEDDDER